jgi:hypothetical protein
MSFDLVYERFLESHTDGDAVFSYRNRDLRLKTRQQLFEKQEMGGMLIPFVSCLLGCRRRLAQAGYSAEEIENIDGTAIGEYSGDIVFISHASDAVCMHFADGTADVEEIAPSIAEFIAGLTRKA